MRWLALFPAPTHPARCASSVFYLDETNSHKEAHRDISSCVIQKIISIELRNRAGREQKPDDLFKWIVEILVFHKRLSARSECCLFLLSARLYHTRTLHFPTIMLMAFISQHSVARRERNKTFQLKRLIETERRSFVLEKHSGTIAGNEN